MRVPRLLMMTLLGVPHFPSGSLSAFPQSGTATHSIHLHFVRGRVYSFAWL